MGQTVVMVTTTRTAAPRRCSIASALDVVGEKWSLLVIRELFLGVRRFNDIAANTGAPRDILTARLRRLEELGGVERGGDEGRAPRHQGRRSPGATGHAPRRWG